MHASRTALSYLMDSARRMPNACAVIDEFGAYSYARLAKDAERFGACFAEHGATGRAVIVMLEKSEETLAIMLGALWAGACYVPVDPNIPTTRLAHIVASLDDPILISAKGVHEIAEIPTLTCTVLSLEFLRDFVFDADQVKVEPVQASAEDPAYVLFTSGSTGAPKGVAVSHGAIVSFIDEFVSTFKFEPSDKFANQAPFDFDISVKDIYGSLASGATLVLVPRHLFMRPQKLVDFLEEHRVTVMVWAVAALCLMSSYHVIKRGSLSSVRMILFSGEVMPAAHLAEFIDAVPQATLFNLYGPTEITCNCLYHRVDPSQEYGSGIPLGRPFGHCAVDLIDENGKHVTEPGRRGEIIVRGPSLALGYVGNPEATQRAFVKDPFEGNTQGRAYRTGDTAVLLESGEFLFCGRRDNQIKYLGHRIELEEIDYAFESLPGVNRCRCAFDRKKSRLRVFYEGDAIESDLPSLARKMLPLYMRPASITKVVSMPLNKNGKSDRARLLESYANGRMRQKEAL